MKFTDYLNKKQNDISSRKNRVSDQIQAVLKQMSVLREKMIESASEGDFDLYNDCDAELKMLNNKLHVLRASSEADFIKREESLKVWSEYASNYNKVFKSKYTSFLKKMKDCADDYKELVRMQNEALLQRNTCNYEVNEDDFEKACNILDMDMASLEYLQDKEKVVCLGHNVPIEVACFYKLGFITRNELDDYRLIAGCRSQIEMGGEPLGIDTKGKFIYTFR